MAAKDIVREENILKFLNVNETKLEDLRTEGLPYIDLGNGDRLYNIESVAIWIMTKEYFGPGNTVYFTVDWNNVYNGFKNRSIAGTGNHDFSFVIPADFKSLVSLKLIGIVTSGSAGSGKSVTLNSTYAKDGESYSQHTESDTDVYEIAASAGLIGSLDLSAVFTSIEAGDLCGVNVDHNAIGGYVYYLAIELKYEPGTG